MNNHSGTNQKLPVGVESQNPAEYMDCDMQKLGEGQITVDQTEQM
jgi:hypothetical protein